MPLSPDQAFSEAQARAIFEEAARRQAVRQTADAPGLTLAELQAVAREAGLDPDLVAAAAAHVTTEAPESKSPPGWDVPEAIRVERVLPGEVPDALWEAMVAELRRTFGQAGRAGQVGRVREWTTEGATATSNNTMPIHVEAIPEDGRTRLVLTQSLTVYREAAYMLGGILTGTAAVLAVLLSVISGFENPLGLAVMSLLLISFGVLGFFGTRGTARTQHRKQSATFEGVLDRLDLLALRAPVARPLDLAAPAPPETTARLDASLLDEPEAREAAPPSASRTRA